ncbi:MAG: BamA/TamA family outer membrane protein [Sedimentisphaerales bacterium]|nr:BamA/TamA family outer membrane protein [Sedimentisphaerales bacterium]
MCVASDSASAGPASAPPASRESEENTPAAQAPADRTAASPPRTSASAGRLGRAEIIKSIEFIGNHKYRDEVLRERLGFKLGDRLDLFLAEGGRTTIEDIYRKIGFKYVKVSLDKDRLAEGYLLYTIQEGPRVQIKSVKFIGNKSFGAGTLREIVKTKKMRFLVIPAYYRADRVDEDVRRLEDFYYDHGYLNVKVKADQQFAANGRGVRLLFRIDEGPVYRIGEIRFSGSTHYTGEELRERIELREGKVYRRPVAQRDAKAIAQLYREQGYVDADVRETRNLSMKEGDNLAAVEFRITEGRQFRIGRIEVTGNERTRDKVVRRVLDEYHFTPGELYNAKLAPKEGGGLLERYVRYRATAQEAIIRPVNPPESDPNRKDVQVNIEEGMTGVIIPSIGVSTDHGVIGRLDYRQQNFDIMDWPESLGELFSMDAFRGAGQLLHVYLSPGTVYSSYGIDFVDPYWLDRPVEFSVGGRSWERFYESYDEKRLKGTVEFERRLDRLWPLDNFGLWGEAPDTKWRPSIGFRAENVRVGHLDYDAPQEIRDFKGSTALYGARLGIGRSAVDDQFNPAKGHKFGAWYEQVTGDEDFGLLEGSYTHYFTLHTDVLDRKTVLAAKVLAGTVLGSAPPFEKYYAGGSSRYGIRGFEYRGISPRGVPVDPSGNVLPRERKDPIGSDWIFLANAEVVIPLVGENFGGLFFVDSGTVESGQYRLSIGAGFQILIPQLFGNIPMRFEFGWPLFQDDDDEPQVFSISQPGMF